MSYIYGLFCLVLAALFSIVQSAASLFGVLCIDPDKRRQNMCLGYFLEALHHYDLLEKQEKK